MKKLFLFALMAGVVAFADESGLKIGVNADVVGQFGLVEGSSASSRIQVREAEMMFYAPIDHLFDGVLSTAAHQEASGAYFEIHEAYIGSTKLIPRSRFRVGEFFLGVGRLNTFHRHDWPFTSAPKYHRLFFDDEAARDTGCEYSWLTPLPFYLDITVGITSGFGFGHFHGPGTKPNLPTHYVRASTFQSFGGGSGIQLGLNYVGRRDASDNRLKMLGLDAVAKWNDNDNWKYLVQSEFWYRWDEKEGRDLVKDFGFYIFPNIPLASDLWAGVRFDYYNKPTATNFFGPISSYEYSIVPTITYKTSEFATLRMAMHWTEERLGGASLRSDRMIEAQAVFILGAHPAHEF